MAALIIPYPKPAFSNRGIFVAGPRSPGKPIPNDDWRNLDLPGTEGYHRSPMKATWNEPAVRDLVKRLSVFRKNCRVTTLVEVERATRSPFHILVACVISLRTKDEVTAEASARLFGLASTPEALSQLDEATIAKAIFPAGFFNTKAHQLRRISAILVDQHNSQVPRNETDLLALPGVGRKTANLVLGIGHGIPAICVDTHVHRIPNRLGMVSTKKPVQTEIALMAILPTDIWIPINDLLVTFGQNQCHPVSPRCSTCPLDDVCDRVGVERSR